MKAKTIKVKTIDEGLDDFAKAFKKAQSGKSAKTKSGVFFASIEAVRRILTNERIGLLKHIKLFKPNSIYELSKGMGKNIKNVSQDLRFLIDVGLIELENSNNARHSKKPVLLSDHITLELII
jgi:predicted transcriptional regulator